MLHCNIHELIERAEKFDLNSSDEDSPYLRHCVNLVEYTKKEGKYVNPNMEVLGSSIDFRTLFTQYREKGTIEIGETAIECNSYNNDDTFTSQYFFYKLATLMNDRKIIFVFMDLSNYLIQEFDDDTHENLTHSVAYIFYPTRKGKYNMYYINSHGKFLKTYDSYDYSLSSHRSKEVAIPEKDVCMEFLINNAIVNSLNKYLETYEHKITVLYSSTKLYNYLHFNLQNGDNHGTCFIFPYVLWHELMFAFKEEHTCGSVYKERSRVTWSPSITTMTLKDTLDGKNIQRLMELIYSKYDSQLEYIIQKNFYKSLETRRTLIDKNIESRTAYFTKGIMYKILSRFQESSEWIKETTDMKEIVSTLE